MAKKFKTYDEAVEAQKVALADLREAKTALTDYYKKNKLKRDEDYTDDPKHGAKVSRFEKDIEKREATLTAINEQVDELKPKDAKKGASSTKKSKKGKVEEVEKPAKKAKEKKESAPRNTKYDYPEDCVTPEDKKKYRIKMRNAAKSKAEKPKEEKAAPETKTSSKKKSAKVTEEVPAAKSKKKVVKKSRRDEDD